jgi:hypothetical protein
MCRRVARPRAAETRAATPHRNAPVWRIIGLRVVYPLAGAVTRAAISKPRSPKVSPAGGARDQSLLRHPGLGLHYHAVACRRDLPPRCSSCPTSSRSNNNSSLLMKSSPAPGRLRSDLLRLLSSPPRTVTSSSSRPRSRCSSALRRLARTGSGQGISSLRSRVADPAPRAVHDLDRGRLRPGPHRAHVRHPRTIRAQLSAHSRPLTATEPAGQPLLIFLKINS